MVQSPEIGFTCKTCLLHAMITRSDFVMSSSNAHVVARILRETGYTGVLVTMFPGSRAAVGRGVVYG